MSRSTFLFALFLVIPAAAAQIPIFSDNFEHANTGTQGPFTDQAGTARFLTQATFGPKAAQIIELTGTSASDWIVNQFNQPASFHLPLIEHYQRFEQGSDDMINVLGGTSTTLSFWVNAIAGEDQLRQRMAFALSQILVVSNAGGSVLFEIPEALGYYQDLLTEHAFGNYRDLLEAVTYSPAMAYYLTYLGNAKGDPITGRVPDENYAREIMQLFTIGLVQLNRDGNVITDEQGRPIETYSNSDITGLARVFTGLALDCIEPEFDCDSGDPDVWTAPLRAFAEYQSSLPKTFLGLTIPAAIGPIQSISLALDHLFAHPNVAPFISRQLIQRFVTSQPQPAYVERVATAFESGSYRLANGVSVGTGRRGDLKATLAAVLFDPNARSADHRLANSFGKIREPLIRFANWARAFNAESVTPEFMLLLWDTAEVTTLAQHPYRSPSVFNFYRPGFIAPATFTGAAGLTVPELQLVNASTVSSYVNFMTYFIFRETSEEDIEGLLEVFDEFGITLNPQQLYTSFIPDYLVEESLALQPEALIGRLDILLAYGTLSVATRAAIIDVLNATAFLDAATKVKLAIIIIMTSPDYLVQR